VIRQEHREEGDRHRQAVPDKRCRGEHAWAGCPRGGLGRAGRDRRVGDLSLNFEATELPADTGLTLTAYSADPGSPSQDALNLLASWAATLDQAETADTTDGA